MTLIELSAFFNNVTHVFPKVPSLYTALSAGKLAANPAVYGVNSIPTVLDRGEVVEIIVNNNDRGRHPFHLHGHNFQIALRAPDGAGPFDPAAVTADSFTAVPPRRDTVLVLPNSHVVLRYRADNPGVWLFHCHIEWHMASGLVATFIEAPLDLQQSQTIPQDHLDNCNAAGVPTVGNAAANTRDYLDLRGAPAPPGPIARGFTARGIAALVFSIISALLGMAVIIW